MTNPLQSIKPEPTGLYFSSYSFPIDLLVEIFSYLSFKEQIYASRVCKNWYLVFMKRVKSRNPLTQIPFLLKNGSLKIYQKQNGTASALLFANESAMGVIENGDLRIFKNDSLIQTIPNASYCLYRKDPYLFLTSHCDLYKHKLTCVDMLKARAVFQIDFYEILSSSEKKVLKKYEQALLLCTCISINPLKFCTLTASGSYLKWERQGTKLLATENWLILKLPALNQVFRSSLHYAAEVHNQIYVEGVSRKLDQNERLISKPFFHYYSQDCLEGRACHTKLHSQSAVKKTTDYLLQIEKNKEGYLLRALGDKGILAWSWEYDASKGFLQFLTDPNDEWTILSDGNTVFFLFTKTGVLTARCTFAEKPNFAKLFYSHLALIFKNYILLVENSSAKILLKRQWDKEPIIDCLFHNEKFYVLYGTCYYESEKIYNIAELEEKKDY